MAELRFYSRSVGPFCARSRADYRRSNCQKVATWKVPEFLDSNRAIRHSEFLLSKTQIELHRRSGFLALDHTGLMAPAAMHTAIRLDFQNLFCDGFRRFDTSKNLSLLSHHRRRTKGQGSRQICFAATPPSIARTMHSFACARPSSWWLFSHRFTLFRPAMRRVNARELRRLLPQPRIVRGMFCRWIRQPCLIRLVPTLWRN